MKFKAKNIGLWSDLNVKVFQSGKYPTVYVKAWITAHGGDNDKCLVQIEDPNVKIRYIEFNRHIIRFLPFYPISFLSFAGGYFWRAQYRYHSYFEAVIKARRIKMDEVLINIIPFMAAIRGVMGIILLFG